MLLRVISHNGINAVATFDGTPNVQDFGHGGGRSHTVMVLSAFLTNVNARRSAFIKMLMRAPCVAIHCGNWWLGNVRLHRNSVVCQRSGSRNASGARCGRHHTPT